MKQILSAEYENYLLFKHVNWQIDNHPLTVIRGLNKDRKEKDGQYSRNAVGKTLLIEALATLARGEPTWSVNRGSSKAMLNGNAKFTLQIKDENDATYTIQQYAKGNTVKYKVYEGGKDQQIKDISSARQRISELLPLTTDHFYSYTYLTSRHPSILLDGRATERHDHFESLFDLSIYDAVNKLFNKQKYSLDIASKQLTSLQEKKQTLAAETQNVSLEQLQATLATLQARSKKLLAKLELYSDEMDKLSSYLAIAEQIRTALSPNKLQKRLDACTQRLTKLENRYNTLQQRLGAEKTASKIQQQRKQLQQRLAKLNNYDDTEITKSKTAKAKAEQQLERLNKVYNLQTKYAMHLEKYFAIDRQKLPKKWLQTDVNKLEKQLDKLQTELTGLEYSKRNLNSVQSKAPCPTCGQVVSAKHIATHKRTLTLAIDNLTTQVKQLRQCRFIYNLENKLPPEVRQSTQTVRQQITEQQTQIEQHDEILENHQHYIELQRQLHSLPKIKTVKSISRTKLNRLEKTINKLRKQQSVYTNDLKLHNNLNKLGQDYSDAISAKARYTALRNGKTKLAPKLTSINEKFARLSTHYSNEKMLRRQLLEIADEMNKLETEVEDRDLVIALAQAYSPKGIRILQINALTQAYITQLNNFCNFIYPEPYKFSADVEFNAFNIYAQRSGRTADIRSLSVSESRQFQVLSAFALMKLVPMNNRLDIIVLDEIESGMSVVERLHFAREFLPILQTEVPKVIVISPLPSQELYIPDARELTLVRQNHITKMVENNAQ